MTQNPVSRFLGRIPGIDPQVEIIVDVDPRSSEVMQHYYRFRRSVDGESSLLHRNQGLGNYWELDLGACSDHGADLTSEQVSTILPVWAAPGIEDLGERRRALGEVLSQIPGYEDGSTLAQEMFMHVGNLYVGDFVLIKPRPDGRYEFEGYTEPYPGCWPGPAALAASQGDLSVLWPYL